MSNQIELTAGQGRRLFNLMHEPVAGPHEDTVGSPHNPTTRTRAHAAPTTALYRYVMDNGWLQDGAVLVCHGASCSDEFRIDERFGKWTVSHVAVG